MRPFRPKNQNGAEQINDQMIDKGYIWYLDAFWEIFARAPGGEHAVGPAPTDVSSKGGAGTSGRRCLRSRIRLAATAADAERYQSPDEGWSEAAAARRSSRRDDPVSPAAPAKDAPAVEPLRR